MHSARQIIKLVLPMRLLALILMTWGTFSGAWPATNYELGLPRFLCRSLITALARSEVPVDPKTVRFDASLEASQHLIWQVANTETSLRRSFRDCKSCTVTKLPRPTARDLNGLTVVENSDYENWLLGLSRLQNDPHEVGHARLRLRNGQMFSRAEVIHGIWPLRLNGFRLNWMVGRTIRAAIRAGVKPEEIQEVELTHTHPFPPFVITDDEKTYVRSEVNALLNPVDIGYAQLHLEPYVLERLPGVTVTFRATNTEFTSSTGGKPLSQFKGALLWGM